MLRRRFVNIVANSRGSGSSRIYSLHRLDVSKYLFYPSTAEARAAAAAAARTKKHEGYGPLLPMLPELPAPAASFPAACMALQKDDRESIRLFALLSRRAGEGRILCSNILGDSIVFDADMDCSRCNAAVAAMPVALCGQLGVDPIAVYLARPGAAEHDLYLLNSFAFNIPELDADPSPFGVLRFAGGADSESPPPSPEPSRLGGGDWHWEQLPPPPSREEDTCSTVCVAAHAVLDGGRTICVSTGPRTYYFDTVERQWREAAAAGGGGGDTELPFEGGAEYVPGAGLWLGFTAGGGHLCAIAGLSVAMADKPPALEHVWVDAKIPPNWKPRKHSLVDLGHGRFCVFKVYAVLPHPIAGEDEYESEDAWIFHPEITVISGVEVITDGGGGEEDGKPQGALSMVEHRSLCYSSHNNSIECVL
ncbi:hypothetical protein ACP4OV_011900 [Aristida adscensionis]